MSEMYIGFVIGEKRKKAGKIMSDSRLFKIVYHLLEKGHATAPELSDKFEVTPRTIYRDVEALSGAGIPIYAEPGRNGGIYLLHHFVLERALLSERCIDGSARFFSRHFPGSFSYLRKKLRIVCMMNLT